MRIAAEPACLRVVDPRRRVYVLLRVRDTQRSFRAGATPGMNTRAWALRPSPHHASRLMAKRLVNRLLIVLVLLVLVGCDHASKGVAKAELESEGARELIRVIVSLRYVENTDIAFNLLRWVPETIRFPALVAAGAIAVMGLGWLLLRAPQKAS